MNIAFPYIGGNVSSILRLEWTANAPDGGNARQERGLALTTWPGPWRNPGDEGIYYVMPWGALRLPLNETIRVRPPTEEELTKLTVPDNARYVLLAEHDMFIFGLEFLRLDYVMYVPGRSDNENGK